MDESETNDKARLPIVLGEYRLTRLIGEGGMGRVYEGEQLSLDRPVAVKLLAEQFASDVEFLERFRREARIIAAINHHNIVPVYDVGEERGVHYFVMEYVEGESLKAHLDCQGKLTLDEALRVVREVAEGLKAARERGVVHRDIKPDNILVRSDGSVAVADLGIARSLEHDSNLTMSGAALGSPNFMAPEQAVGAGQVDHRADIYALGLTLLNLLTGRLAFVGRTPMAVAMAHVNKPRPSGADLGTPLPDKVEALIGKMSAKDESDRYKSYDDLIRALDAVAGRPVQGGSIDYDLESAMGDRINRRIPIWMWAGGCAGLVVAFYFATRPRAPVVVRNEPLRPVAVAANRENPEVVYVAPVQNPRTMPGPMQHLNQTPAASADAGWKSVPPFALGVLVPANEAESRLRLPLPPPPPLTPLTATTGDSPEEQLVTLKAFATAHPAAYRQVLASLAQLWNEVGDQSVLRKEIEALGESTAASLEAESDALVKRFAEQMRAHVRDEDYASAKSVWLDFPPVMRTFRGDLLIYRAMTNHIPAVHRGF